MNIRNVIVEKILWVATDCIEIVVTGFDCIAGDYCKGKLSYQEVLLFRNDFLKSARMHCPDARIIQNEALLDTFDRTFDQFCQEHYQLKS